VIDKEILQVDPTFPKRIISRWPKCSTVTAELILVEGKWRIAEKPKQDK